ncbi:hypothetical protein DCS_01346 [Drechmeria coniospora]|uniref:BZIP domain-containing protein n=1 Tax=Drechmeria coniospora TaxID=98403 RepID=A0A151GT12_DRECN|nr:hypothetical protein DCS_01346 [Drechmeria coniospora]KYK60210.1 hypothetical protein DCS_01346 [Drechmeria coniospora]
MAPRDGEPLSSMSISPSIVTPSSVPATSTSMPSFSDHTGLGSHPSTSAGIPAPPARPRLSGRISPPVSYPLPQFSETDKTKSPKLPRSLSFSHASSFRGVETRRQSYVASVSPAKRPYETAAPDVHRYLPRLQHNPNPGMHPPPNHGLNRPDSTHPSSHSTDRMHYPRSLLEPRDGQGQDRPQSLYSHSTPQGAPGSQPVSAYRGLESGTFWSEDSRRSGMSRAASSAEGQQAYMTLPGSDMTIPVQVDYSQASKKADEKRQRNAKASTRHRRKKKTMQEENMRQLEDLRDERHQLACELEDTRRQRDFYRDERNRLREVVVRTPGIHHHAVGPPTPSIRVVEERSAGAGSQVPRPRLGTEYSSDQSSAGRPARRRRIEDETTKYSATGLGPPLGETPGGSSPVPALGHTYGTVSAASLTAGERLPPLRAMEGQVAAQGLGTAHDEQEAKSGPWRTGQNRQFETGWAREPK